MRVKLPLLISKLSLPDVEKRTLEVRSALRPDGTYAEERTLGADDETVLPETLVRLRVGDFLPPPPP